MNTFAYTAFDSKGKLFRGNVEEKSWTQALRRVREMGLFPTSVKEQPQRALLERFRGENTHGAFPVSPKHGARRCGRVSGRVLTAFTRQLATLLEAGIPLLRGLRSIQQQEEDGRLRKLLGEVIQGIEGGSSLSEALGRYPKVFSRLYVNMVVAGETAGMLESSLARLAEFMERSLKIRGRIKSALYYPAAVILLAAGILAGLAMFVIPRFKEVFADLAGGTALPAFTELVLNSSNVIKDHAVVALAAACALVVAFRLIESKPAGRAVFDRLKLKVPVIGRIMRKLAIARFARTLGTMLQNGVPVLQALVIARETAGNAVFAGAIQKTHDRVKDGDNLTPPLHASGVFPPTVISMIDVGEQTGALPGMLLKVADNYEEEVDNSISAAMSLLEPALIIFLAIVVGSIVIALFLPIFQIMNQGFEPAPDAGP